MIDEQLMKYAEKIESVALTSYLSNSGWTNLPTKKAYMRIYQYKLDQEMYQVTVPMDKGLSDYGLVMYMAVESVGKKEQRSMEEVLRRLLNMNADMLKICIRTDRNRIEGNPIAETLKVYNAAKELLVITARDLLKKQMGDQDMDRIIKRMLDDYKFGLSSDSGVGVTLICPFIYLDEGQEYVPLSFLSDVELCINSMTRRILSRIMENITRIKTGIEMNDLSGIKDSTEEMSPEFIVTMNELVSLAANGGIEFIAEWSPVIGADIMEAAKKNIRLTYDYYQPITALADTLNKKPGLHNKKTPHKL